MGAVDSGCSSKWFSKDTIWPALVQWLVAGGGKRPAGTSVAVVQQGPVIVQLAPKCPIFHGRAEPPATDVPTYRESISVCVLNSLLMTIKIIVTEAGKLQSQFYISRKFKVIPITRNIRS